MQPGTYEITVEMAGFKRLTQRGIVLAVAQQMNIPFMHRSRRDLREHHRHR